FVMSGAFVALPDIIRRRLNKQPIGFRGVEEEHAVEDTDIEILRQVRSEDLIRFGFESEFVGRLPVTVTLNDLDVEGLYRILQNPNSTVIQGKKRDFKAYDIEIEFEDEALRRIAELAAMEHTGARGLVSVVDRILLKFEKSLPDTSVTRFKVTRALVEDPQGERDRLLNQHYLKMFQKRFLASNGIVITFSEEALELLCEKAQAKKQNLEEACNDLLRDYEYGLRLLGCESFTVDADIVRDPKSRLEEMIKQSYSKTHQA
ncbi:MAG TPA: ATP-dependent protease, partial [bacterium]|nr:ATP-dependent protease [bacterium]